MFLDREPDSETPRTKTLWVCDFHTNQQFTLKTNSLNPADLDDLPLWQRRQLGDIRAVWFL